MGYSKSLRDIVDQCLLKDYKRRPSVHDILALPEIKDKMKEQKIEFAEPQEKPSRPSKEMQREKAAIKAKASVDQIKKAREISKADELNRYADMVKKPYRPEGGDFMAQKKPPPAPVKEEKKFSPLNFLPNNIADYAKNAAKMAADKVQNLFKKDSPEVVHHARGHSDGNANIYKPVLRGNHKPVTPTFE